MSRKKEPVEIHAPHWDEDEYAFVRTSYSLPAAQRVLFHGAHIQQLDMDSLKTASLEMLEASTTHMAAAILEMLQGWTLRDTAVPYRKSAERAKLDLTLEAILDLDMEDIAFLFTSAFSVFKEQTSAKTSGPLITPDAEADGLTPENFRSADPDGGHLQGGTEVAQPVPLALERKRA